MNKLNKLRQVKDSNYIHPISDSSKTEDYESLREKAESFLDENYFHLKADLRTSNYSDVISALVDFKKETK